MNARPTRRRTARIAAGFTLIELLVVIGIIAILSSLLVSQITSAINRGKTAACLSNLRQIGVALQGYAADNNGSLPPLTNFARTSTSDNIPVLDTVLLPYTGSNTAVFRCPADTVSNYFQASGNSYNWNPLPMYNEANNTYNFQLSNLNFQMLNTTELSQIMLVVDKEAFHHITGGSNISTNNENNQHFQNLLYADGHAAGNQ